MSAEDSGGEREIRMDRRTLGSDEELRVLGEIAVIASRIEFVTREFLIALIDPLNPDVGVNLTKGWPFDRCAVAAADLLTSRFPNLDSPRLQCEDALKRSRVAMNLRNQYLHSRYHWDLDDHPSAGTTMFTHRRKTGENEAERITVGDLHEAANALMQGLMGVTTSLQAITQELGIEAQYWERVYQADVPAN